MERAYLLEGESLLPWDQLSQVAYVFLALRLHDSWIYRNYKYKGASPCWEILLMRQIIGLCGETDFICDI